MQRQYLRKAYHYVSRKLSTAAALAATDFLFEDSTAYLFEDSVQFEFEDAPRYYLRPGGVDYYRRPGGVDRYLRP